LLGEENRICEPSPSVPSTDLQGEAIPDSGNESVEIKCTDEDIEVIEIAKKAPRKKTPYVREFDHQNIEPEAALEHFFDFLHPKKSIELQLQPSESSIFK
jgi:hypothetical protein